MQRFLNTLAACLYFALEAKAAAPLFTAVGGNSVDITYDPSTERVKFVAQVKQDTYLALGIGNHEMKNTDMVIF